MRLLTSALLLVLSIPPALFAQEAAKDDKPALAGPLAELAKDYQARGVAFVAIQSNDAAKYPDDSPAKMAEEIEKRGYSFSYVSDPTQEIAKAYRAACTPDFYVFDGERKLAYRGQLDASRPDNGKPVTGADLRAPDEAEQRPLARQRVPEAADLPLVGVRLEDGVLHGALRVLAGAAVEPEPHAAQHLLDPARVEGVVEHAVPDDQLARRRARVAEEDQRVAGHLGRGRAVRRPPRARRDSRRSRWEPARRRSRSAAMR